MSMRGGRFADDDITYTSDDRLQIRNAAPISSTPPFGTPSRWRASQDKQLIFGR